MQKLKAFLIYSKQEKINVFLDSKNTEGDMTKGIIISIALSASTLNPFPPSSRIVSCIYDADLFASASIKLKYFTESKGFTSEYS